MDDEFSWVPFYEEMSMKLRSYRSKQMELVAILKKAGVNGLADQNPQGTPIELSEIDPFTFNALINKHSTATRISILKTIREELQLVSKVPMQFSGVPNVDARQAWLFPYKFERGLPDVSRLWDLHEEVVKGVKLTEQIFSAAGNVKYAGSAKLTQAIFRAAPTRFFPVDGQTRGYLTRLGLPSKFRSAEEYQEISINLLKSDRPLYVHSHQAWLANQNVDTESRFQLDVLKAATSKAKAGSSTNPKAGYQEPPGGVAVPPKVTKESSAAYPRNVAVAAQALVNAQFQCEIDPNHKTFVSSSKNQPYVEAHHLIPMSNQGGFNVSLDVMANVVALCPTCHRLLHHGRMTEKKAFLRVLLEKRQGRLQEKGIRPAYGTLQSYYHGDFLDENA